MIYLRKGFNTRSFRLNKSLGFLFKRLFISVGLYPKSFKSVYKEKLDLILDLKTEKGKIQELISDKTLFKTLSTEKGLSFTHLEVVERMRDSGLTERLVRLFLSLSLIISNHSIASKDNVGYYKFLRNELSNYFQGYDSSSSKKRRLSLRITEGSDFRVSLQGDRLITDILQTNDYTLEEFKVILDLFFTFILPGLKDLEPDFSSIEREIFDLKDKNDPEFLSGLQIKMFTVLSMADMAIGEEFRRTLLAEKTKRWTQR